MGAENLALHWDSIPGTFQPILSRYTDWAIRAHQEKKEK
jgi:hypothetical protein